MDNTLENQKNKFYTRGFPGKPSTSSETETETSSGNSAASETETEIHNPPPPLPSEDNEMTEEVLLTGEALRQRIIEGKRRREEKDRKERQAKLQKEGQEEREEQEKQRSDMLNTWKTRDRELTSQAQESTLDDQLDSSLNMVYELSNIERQNEKAISIYIAGHGKESLSIPIENTDNVWLLSYNGYPYSVTLNHFDDFDKIAGDTRDLNMLSEIYKSNFNQHNAFLYAKDMLFHYYNHYMAMNNVRVTDLYRSGGFKIIHPKYYKNYILHAVPGDPPGYMDESGITVLDSFDDTDLFTLNRTNKDAANINKNTDALEYWKNKALTKNPRKKTEIIMIVNSIIRGNISLVDIINFFKYAGFSNIYIIDITCRADIESRNETHPAGFDPDRTYLDMDNVVHQTSKMRLKRAIAAVQERLPKKNTRWKKLNNLLLPQSEPVTYKKINLIDNGITYNFKIGEDIYVLYNNQVYFAKIRSIQKNVIQLMTFTSDLEWKNYLNIHAFLERPLGPPIEEIDDNFTFDVITKANNIEEAEKIFKERFPDKADKIIINGRQDEQSAGYKKIKNNKTKKYKIKKYKTKTKKYKIKKYKTKTKKYKVK